MDVSEVGGRVFVTGQEGVGTSSHVSLTSIFVRVPQSGKRMSKLAMVDCVLGHAPVNLRSFVILGTVVRRKTSASGWCSGRRQNTARQ